MVIELSPKNGRLRRNEDLDKIVLSIIDDDEFEEIRSAITADEFTEWYRERRYTENIKEGKPYFNGPGKIKPADQQSPSKLLQCKRKTIYSQLKAPKETDDPLGIFWIGQQLEDELIFPFIEYAAGDYYTTNSIWVDFSVSTDAGEVVIRGSTDPVIVDTDSKPILLTEIKSKDSVDHLEKPDEHHLAQAMAYLLGLSEKYEQNINQAVIIYVAKSDLSLKPFFVSLDEDFWEERVLPWISDVKAYRLENELPPATPEFDWECNFCPYRERCGRGDREYMDMPATGLLPLFEYPKQSTIDYLETHEEEELTPTLANLHPELVDRFDVQDWHCDGCNSTFPWDAFEWSSDSVTPIKCPQCEKDGSVRYLSGQQFERKGRGYIE